MKLTAFPNPMQRIAIGMLAAFLVAFLLEIPPFSQHQVVIPGGQDFHSYRFQKVQSYTLYMSRLVEGLTFTYIPKADITIYTGDRVGPGLSAPQARLRQSLRRGETRLAEDDVSAGMSAVITPQPTFVDLYGKEVAFMAGP